ncbi:MAG: SDR family oxidoreductase [Spirochaetaceae bacterium]|nr:SDR family oxidoreductase [Myxococcales bacterium]MCB9723562.1 SDR family oxidoreductase [Spirochaetaceae bacterium]
MILENKVVIVSGIGPGLGQELAINAGKQGAKVVLAARTKSFLEEVDAIVRKTGAETLVVPTDITKPDQCQNLVDQTMARFGRIDALVNSAYTGGKMAMFVDSDLDDWRATMEVNFYGSLTLTQKAVPAMKAGGGGAIVMINTMVQRKPIPTQAAYASSKGALTAATRMLAKELGPDQIRVNSISMGWMWGPPVEGYVKGAAKQMGVSEEQVLAGITKDIPLGRIPDDSDCANAALFLASDLSRVITGASLDCNGGEFMP